MTESIRNKTVIVTGASAGIGRAVALACGRAGCRVGLIARDTERLNQVAREIEEGGGRAMPLPLDVAESEAVEAAAEQAERVFGAIDIWINVAMVTVYSRVADMSAQEFRRVTEVTYLGYVHGTLTALRRMARRGWGTIVQVGSSLSYRAIPLQSAYCASKFAIRGFTDALRAELIHDGSPIRLTMVQLPAVNTPQFDWARNRMPHRPRPVPPIFQPEAVAQAILHAAATTPRELWVDWSTVKVILGSMVAPRLLDDIVARQAWRGEEGSQPARPGAPDNLFASVPGPWGAHGRFDDEAADKVHSFSAPWVRTGAAIAGLAAIAAMGWALRGNAGQRPAVISG